MMELHVWIRQTVDRLLLADGKLGCPLSLIPYLDMRTVHSPSMRP